MAAHSDITLMSAIRQHHCRVCTSFISKRQSLQITQKYFKLSKIEKFKHKVCIAKLSYSSCKPENIISSHFLSFVAALLKSSNLLKSSTACLVTNEAGVAIKMYHKLNRIVNVSTKGKCLG